MSNVNYRKEPAVYALHTGDHRYRYVGSTTVNSQNRLYQHISRAQEGHSAPVYQWMREVGVRNVVVTDLIRVDDMEMLGSLEVCAIVKLIDEGFDLTNAAWSKGRGFSVASNEYRRGFRPKHVKAEKIKADRSPKHGTRVMYEKYHCKCDDCRLVGAQRNAARRGRPIPQNIADLRRW